MWGGGYHLCQTGGGGAFQVKMNISITFETIYLLIRPEFITILLLVPNLQNFRIEKEPAPSTDWRVFGDIYDNNGNLLGTFGPDGTSVFGWWVLQDVMFQQNYSNQFAIVMAQEIVNGTAE